MKSTIKIRITQDVNVAPHLRPEVGKVYEATVINCPRGQRYDIEVNGEHTMIFPRECEVL